MVPEPVDYLPVLLLAGNVEGDPSRRGQDLEPLANLFLGEVFVVREQFRAQESGRSSETTGVVN